MYIYIHECRLYMYMNADYRCIHIEYPTLGEVIYNTCIDRYRYIYIYTYVCIYIDVYRCMYVCMYACMCR